MTVKRMRVFAGPNGSGKTTIFKSMLDSEKVRLGIYVNADDIEKTLKEEQELDFGTYHLKIDPEHLTAFLREQGFSSAKRKEPDLPEKLRIVNNKLYINATIDSYLAADLAAFIRHKLLENGLSFTYETVMSHPGKIDFLKKAQACGYRVYVYYIATDDPEININRVHNRVQLDGHQVSDDVIKSRYYRSLRNLRSAIQYTNRAYIFDNSGEQVMLIAEITDGDDVHRNTKVETPLWVAEYLFKMPGES